MGSPETVKETKKLNMVQAINLALMQEMMKDDSVIVLGQDVGVDGGVFRVTDGLHEKFGEERVIDTPLAEAGIVGTALGMALAGLKPVAEIQFDGFSYLTLTHLESQMARYRTRTMGQRACPMVVRFPYGGLVRAMEHHSESREVAFAHIPGIKVVTPSTPRNARALMLAAIRDPDTVIFMEPKRLYRAFKEEVPLEEEFWEIGKAQVVQEGSDLTVISWGSMMPVVKEAVRVMQEKKKKSIELIDLLTISPMDTATFIESVKKTGRCVIVQESMKSFGPASEIIARINDKALMSLQAPVKRLSNYDVTMPYFGREHFYIPGKERIEQAIEETLNF